MPTLPLHHAPTLPQREVESAHGPSSHTRVVAHGKPRALKRTAVLPPEPSSGARPPTLDDERFVFVAPLGVGGEGDVWRAYDRDFARFVAVKRAHVANRAKFAAEARTAGALEHPAIVPVYDVGDDADGNPYLVMRCVEGESLESIIERLADGDAATHASYCFERRTEIFRRLCEAVSFAHARGVIHCDIKPANVIVGAHGEVFLTDWGIARRLDAQGAGRLVSGTPAYMAPEQAAGGSVDVRADVHGLAALFYELLALRPYLDTEGRSMTELLGTIASHRPSHPSDVVTRVQPRVPMDLGWLVLDGLHRDPAKRYPSVDALLERLDRRAQGRVPIQCAQTLVKRSTGELVRTLERYPAVLPIAVFVAIVASVVAAIR